MALRNTNNLKSKKNKKDKETRAAFKNNKGNWEFNFFQKKFDPNHESNIKILLKPENSFNPANVHKYITPEISKRDLIQKKKDNGEHLKSGEKIILDESIKREENAIKNDIKEIEDLKANDKTEEKTQHLTAKPKTKFGKTKLLLETLKYFVKLNNIESIANIYLRLMETYNFELYEELKKDYKIEIETMNKIVQDVDLIKLQFTKFYSQMPPLNRIGFNSFDKWQIDVIKNIDENISTVVNAPTSAGKSVLAAYTTTKGRTLFVVPTDVLAWQMSAYIGNIIGTNVPIITTTYTTNPSRDKLIEILNKSSCIVGTPDMIVDYLPYLNNDFKWIVIDEIHMIGKSEGSGMEVIAKILNNIPILALSATIGNTDELVDWFQLISPKQKVEKIICTKRFFNLHKSYFDPDCNDVITLHPLSLIEEEMIADGSILTKSLQPTPPNIWDIALKLKEQFDIGELDPYLYFKRENRIELDDVNLYFSKLLNFIVDSYKENKTTIMNIINNYKYESLSCGTVDVIKLIFKLKEEKKTPTIIFQKNTMACLRIARQLVKDLEDNENKKYPKLSQERLKIVQMAKKIDKHNDKLSKSDKATNSKNSDKKELKEMMGGVKLKKAGYNDKPITSEKIENIIPPSLQEPHPDFNLNDNIFFTESDVEDWVDKLKIYFPNTGPFYHPIIKLLWRGIGVYAKGLPEPYLRLVQTLACKKQLAIVVSDISLVFGVSMPFRSVVIIRDDKIEDDLDSMLFHQMCGRAGRRGLDKEGHIIFAGYSWKRIKELSISTAPIVTGSNSIIYTIPQANKLSELSNTNYNWNQACANYLDKTINSEDCAEFMSGLESNFQGGWDFAMSQTNINHLHMNWKLRYSEDSIIVSFILPYLRRAFESSSSEQIINQINLAHFLCRFISIKEFTKKSANCVLQDPLILSEAPYNIIASQLEDMQIDIPKKIDGRLYQSIKSNSLFKSNIESDTDELRNNLMEFGMKVQSIQHFCFHSKITGLTKLLGKLLTRIWWIYHSSSPLSKSFITYETEEYKDVEMYEESSDDDIDSESEETE